VTGANSLNEAAVLTVTLPPELRMLVTSAISAALPVFTAVMSAIRHLLADKDAEIDALRAELDRAGGRNVVVCMERDAALMQAQCAGEPPGTILRFTDTGGEMELTGQGWQPRSRR
jgi:hypothetical protein